MGGLRELLFSSRAGGLENHRQRAMGLALAPAGPIRPEQGFAKTCRTNPALK